ncbi:MAG: site-specific integrase [Chloroflexota bacterium]|nr:site-specific integrase [Chloroflexota bacterium]
MNPLNEYQVNDLLDAVKDHRFYNLFHLAVNTGMRRSELLGLQWKDVDHLNIYVTRVLHHNKGGEIVIEEPKTKQSKRRLDIDPATALELHKYRQWKEANGSVCKDDDLIFMDLDGKLFSPSSVYRTFKNTLSKLGIDDVRFHDLRHTHASLMLKQNTNPKIIQERLGHSSTMITMDTYGHLMPNMQKDAVLNFADLLKQAREEWSIESVG